MNRRLVVASGNRHKVAELRAMVIEEGLDVQVVSQTELGAAPEIEESSDTFAGNALRKAQGIAAWLRERSEPGETLVLADDSGIEVAILDGAPGVHSARFAGSHATDGDNNLKLVQALKAAGVEGSAARYRCVLAVARVDARGLASSVESAVPATSDDENPEQAWRALLFDGQWPVEVRVQSRGSGGFGYDPHAWLVGEERTVAELAPPEKARLSHRGEATRAFLSWLRTTQS